MKNPIRIEPSIWEGDTRMPASWRVLAGLLRGDSLGQADLRNRTGLSHPVIVQQVAQLRRAGLITFGAPISGQPGRPRVPMTFNWNFRRLLAVEVHSSGITVQATDLRGELQGSISTGTIAEWSTEGIKKAIVKAVRTAIRSNGSPFAAIGVVIPGIISADHQVAISCLDVADWADVNLGEELTAEFNIPVLLENDANALALALASNPDEDTDSILAISMRQQVQVGLGMIFNGRVIRGIHAGSFGNTPIENGTLETMLRASRNDEGKRNDALVALFDKIADLVTAINPKNLVMQGDDRWSEDDLTILRATLEARCYAPAFADLTLEYRQNAPIESLTGITSLLSDYVLNLENGLITSWSVIEQPAAATKRTPIIR